MNTYKEMNEKIVEILRLSDEPTCLYAAQRIEELEQENSKMIARVLEIVDEEDQSRRNELGVIFDNGVITVADRIRNRIKELKTT